MLSKEQKIEIIENAVKEHFGVKKVNLLNTLKYINTTGDTGEKFWRILINGDDLIGQTYSKNGGFDSEFIVRIDANKIKLSRQSVNLVNEIYNMLPKHLKQNQD